MGVTHFDEAERAERAVGHIRARWSFLGESAGSDRVGLKRIEIPAGGWSTPAHEHGREEEIFYVRSGRGLSWHDGATAEIGPGDCIVYIPGWGAHTVHALDDLDLLAFGTRMNDEAPSFPRLGRSLVNGRLVANDPEPDDDAPAQFIEEAKLGPPPLPAQPGPRPSTIVNRGAVARDAVERPRVARIRRNLGRAAGSRDAGLQYVEVAAGKEATAQHCHTLEEEIFVVLQGEGTLVLGAEDETPLRAGHVVARPAGTGVAHLLRAGERGLTFLAYGLREPGDMCYYPRSQKIAFRGLGVLGRIDEVHDYWDGED
jgi:uncharacterized cupin superfamily protein